MDRNNDPDLGSADVSLSKISYLVEGDIGTRTQKIEWNNLGFYADISELGASTNFVNFQLWLYEETGTIEIHFGEMNVINPELIYDDFNGAGAILVSGFNDDTGESSEVLYLAGSAENPTLISGNDIYGYYYNPLIGTPTNGTVYRFERTSVGVNDPIPVQDKYSLSPNPATDILSIGQNIDQSKIQSIEIYNASGQLVKNEIITQRGLNISSLPAGIFYLYIQDEEELSVQRFVKMDK